MHTQVLKLSDLFSLVFSKIVPSFLAAVHISSITAWLWFLFPQGSLGLYSGKSEVNKDVFDLEMRRQEGSAGEPGELGGAFWRWWGCHLRGTWDAARWVCLMTSRERRWTRLGFFPKPWYFNEKQLLSFCKSYSYSWTVKEEEAAGKCHMKLFELNSETAHSGQQGRCNRISQHSANEDSFLAQLVCNENP